MAGHVSDVIDPQLDPAQHALHGARVDVIIDQIASGSPMELAQFMTRWIELKKGDGTLDALYAYWILGTNTEPTKPRWSILRDVLHWVD